MSSVTKSGRMAKLPTLWIFSRVWYAWLYSTGATAGTAACWPKSPASLRSPNEPSRAESRSRKTGRDMDRGVQGRRDPQPGEESQQNPPRRASARGASTAAKTMTMNPRRPRPHLIVMKRHSRAVSCSPTYLPISLSNCALVFQGRYSLNSRSMFPPRLGIVWN